jgi:hypothetical protein
MYNGIFTIRIESLRGLLWAEKLDWRPAGPAPVRVVCVLWLCGLGPLGLSGWSARLASAAGEHRDGLGCT